MLQMPLNWQFEVVLTVLLEVSMNSTWIQHHCDAKCCTKHCKIQSKNELSMKSAWLQHESHTSLSLPFKNKGLRLKQHENNLMECKWMARLNSTESGMNLTWIRHIWKYGCIRHENGMNLIRWKFGQNSQKNQTRFVWMVFWIGGLELWGVKQLKKSIHAGFMLDSCTSTKWMKRHFLKRKIQTANPNRCRKSWNFCNFRINLGCGMVLNSCWFHAGFMHNQTWNVILPLVSFSVILRFGGIGGFFKILVQIWLGVLLNQWQAFMLMSFLLWIFTMLCATFCITMVLNSCWIHADFKQNSENHLKLPIKWHFKHLSGL